jgi:hypothetical protein
MALLALDLLARVIARAVDARPPFSAPFTLWLSITPALRSSPSTDREAELEMPSLADFTATRRWSHYARLQNVPATL